MLNILNYFVEKQPVSTDAGIVHNTPDVALPNLGVGVQVPLAAGPVEDDVDAVLAAFLEVFGKLPYISTIISSSRVVIHLVAPPFRAALAKVGYKIVRV